MSCSACRSSRESAARSCSTKTPKRRSGSAIWRFSSDRSQRTSQRASALRSGHLQRVEASIADWGSRVHDQGTERLHATNGGTGSAPTSWPIHPRSQLRRPRHLPGLDSEGQRADSGVGRHVRLRLRGARLQRAAGSIAVPGEAVNPEFAWTYEGGVKRMIAGGRARVNTAVFYTDYQDYGLQSSSPRPRHAQYQ